MNRIKTLFSYRLLIVISIVFLYEKSNAQSNNEIPLIENFISDFFLDSLISIQSDSLVLATRNDFNSSLTTGDTLKAIESLNSLSQIYCSRVNYAQSYDGYWQALLLADRINDEKTKADSYNGLAILYSLYERRDEALKYYLLSLKINKELVLSDGQDSSILRENYFPLAIHHKFDKNYKLAHAYLDSSELVSVERGFDNRMIRSERAHVLSLEHEFQSAKRIFSDVIQGIIVNTPWHLVILYSHMGDLYYESGDLKNSMLFYTKSIVSAYENKSHLNYVPDVYKKLSQVMTESGETQLAYDYMKLSNEIYETLYSSRSPNNKYLLEIKDDFRIEKELRLQLAVEQKLERLEQDQQISNLRIIVLVISIIFLLSLGYFIFKYWRAKHKAEKKEIQQQRLLEKQKSLEILNIKNNELTGSTLQIIAKDQLLTELKDNLKDLNKTFNSKDIRGLIKDIDLNKDQSWLDFENRFTAVNKDFFENLKSKYDRLKPYDLKICALIKLGFSGKEMAQLLGISAESANTSRYRLRKKLGLNKEENLVEFIDKF
ncbi:MAG: hypothetical protein JXR07_12515 [Reichenbachiella sp.]